MVAPIKMERDFVDSYRKEYKEKYEEFGKVRKVL